MRISTITLSDPFMSLKLVLMIVLLCVFSAFLFTHHAGRENAIAFCSGEKCNLARLEIRGQGVNISLTDRDSLRYLLNSPRLNDEPTGAAFTNGYSFNAWIYGGFLIKGRIDIFISQPVGFMRLIYFDSYFGDFNQKYLLIGADAPAQLRQCMKSLVYSNDSLLRR